MAAISCHPPSERPHVIPCKSNSGRLCPLPGPRSRSGVWAPPGTTKSRDPHSESGERRARFVIAAVGSCKSPIRLFNPQSRHLIAVSHSQQRQLPSPSYLALASSFSNLAGMAVSIIRCPCLEYAPSESSRSPAHDIPRAEGRTARHMGGVFTRSQRGRAGSSQSPFGPHAPGHSLPRAPDARCSAPTRRPALTSSSPVPTDPPGAPAPGAGSPAH